MRNQHDRVARFEGEPSRRGIEDGHRMLFFGNLKQSEDLKPPLLSRWQRSGCAKRGFGAEGVPSDKEDRYKRRNDDNPV